MSKRDYYEVLGVAKDAGVDELKKTYPQLATNCPPASNLGHHKVEGQLQEAKGAA